MQFLKTLFWVMIAVVAVIFSLNNWVGVPVALWGGLILEAKLPVLLLASFLVGFLPVYLLLQASRWRLKRRADAAERALADLTAADLATAEAAVPPRPVEPLDAEAGRPLHGPSAAAGSDRLA